MHRHVRPVECTIRGRPEAQFSVNGRGSLGLRQRGVLERWPWRLTKSHWRKVPPKKSLGSWVTTSGWMNYFDEKVDEDNVDELLEKAVEEIKADIEEDQDKDSITGIQAFHFKFVIIEDIYY